MATVMANGIPLINFKAKKYVNQISNAGHDERDQLKGGKAGDTGGKTKYGEEWGLKDWYSYKNGGWSCVLRHPNKQVRECIAWLAIAAAQNNNIGYDQTDKLNYWNNLKKVGYNPSKIKTKCETDCSGGVCANVKATGYLLNIDKLKKYNLTQNYSKSAYMRKQFKEMGFKVLTEKKYLTSSAYLVPGDILLKDIGGKHTCTCVCIGSKSNYTQLRDQKVVSSNSKTTTSVTKVKASSTTTITSSSSSSSSASLATVAKNSIIANTGKIEIIESSNTNNPTKVSTEIVIIQTPKI